MNSMTAFFHAALLNLAINDLPGYDDKRELTQKNWRDLPPVSLGIPTLGAGEWNWLQPYVRPKPKVPGTEPLPQAEPLPASVPPTSTTTITTTDSDDGTPSSPVITNPLVVVDESQPTFNSFAIDKRGDLTKPGLQKGPYVAAEGYLQLRSPLTSKASQNLVPPGPNPDTGTGAAAGTDTNVTGGSTVVTPPIVPPQAA
jgi:hypothetical protein